MGNQVLLTLICYRAFRTQLHIAGNYSIIEPVIWKTIKRIESVLMKLEALQVPGTQKLSGRYQEARAWGIDAIEISLEYPGM